MTGELAAWLREPALVPVWVVARERLERNGVAPRGAVTVGGLGREGRHAVSGLLGRPVLRESVRVDLASLDAALRARSGVGGLVAVLEALGGRVRNRAAERSSHAAAREVPYAAVRDWLSAHPEAATLPWVEEWLTGVRRSGVLARVPDASVASAALVRALGVSAGLTADGTPTPVARTELAARAAGDAHALDEGTLLAQLVVRALAVAAGEPVPPPTPVARRALWEQYGVSADRVSSTCLVLGLRTVADTPVAHRLRIAADAGDPVHVSAWDLARGELAVAPGAWVLVCENPRVLEAVAEAHAGAVPVVCTSGMPGLVTVELLHRLARSGADLVYHGDFDWPGLAIANRLVAHVGCRPWRMSSADYLRAARDDGPRLEGAVVQPCWEPRLADVMCERGVAVHEEAVLESLLRALPR